MLFKKPWIVYLLTSLFLLAFLGWHFAIGPSDKFEGSFFNQNENAIWIRHSWVDTDKSWEEISELVKNFENHGITYVYVHAGPVEEDGTVPDYKYVYAKQFVNRLKAINPNIKYQAWLGQLRSKIDLDDADKRARIVELANEMTVDIGFDGIHYDFETIDGYDEGFVKLVQETKTKVGDRLVSIAIEEYIPPLMFEALKLITEVKDSTSGQLLLDLRDSVDHYVVMTYDTKMTDPKIYSWLVKQEVIAISRLLPNQNIFIGIPSYEDDRPTFNPEAENVLSGLTGVIDGLNSRRTRRDAIQGVAIYANWETDASEWKTYRNLWMGKF